MVSLRCDKCGVCLHEVKEERCPPVVSGDGSARGLCDDDRRGRKCGVLKA